MKNFSAPKGTLTISYTETPPETEGVSCLSQNKTGTSRSYTLQLLLKYVDQVQCVTDSKKRLRITKTD